MQTILRGLLTGEAPLIMGILNTTPDSFSDGGHFFQLDSAIQQAEQLIADGADIIDVGGESTRPGAQDVSQEKELDRVIPVIEALRQYGVPISIDTSKAHVMEHAIKAGACMVNDVRALQEDGAVEVVAKYGVEVCLMHMQGQPRSMQQSPAYNNVTQEVITFLQQRVEACVGAGIDYNQICIDPGFGFGKTLENNCQLMKELSEFKKLQLPLLIGVSRKSMIGDILDVPVNDRLIGSIAAAQFALHSGANILRVHDVKETAHMVHIYQAFK